MNVDALLSRYKPAEQTVTILLDGSLAAQIEAVETQIREARRTEQGLKSRVPKLAAELDQLKAAADEQTVTVTMRAMPGGLYDEMKTAHPPTAAQWEKYKEQARAMPMFGAYAPEYDPEGLAPELIAASVALIDGDPVKWSKDDGVKLWATLHDGARADLLQAAHEVNGRRSARPLFSSDTDTTSSIAADSTTPPNMESLSASLADG